MMFLHTLIRQRSVVPVAFAVVASVFFITALVQGATTISTDITTDGNIYATSTMVVDGATTFNGNVTVGNASTDTLTITANASTTNALTVGGDFFVNGFATTTSADGNFDTDGTLTVAGATTLNGNVTLGDAAGDIITITGNATTTNALTVEGFFYVNGFATTTPTNGNFNTDGTIGVASTTPSEELSVTGDGYFDSAATTTVHLKSTAGSDGGGCLEMTGADGTVYRAYIDNTAWVVEAGVCK